MAASASRSIHFSKLGAFSKATISRVFIFTIGLIPNKLAKNLLNEIRLGTNRAFKGYQLPNRYMDFTIAGG